MEALAEDLAIRTCGDLLLHLPFRYEDRTRFHRVAETVPGPVQVQLRGTIRKVKEVQQKRVKARGGVRRRARGCPAVGLVQGGQMGGPQPARRPTLRVVGPNQ